jgi:hypothetical protein
MSEETQKALGMHVKPYKTPKGKTNIPPISTFKKGKKPPRIVPISTRISLELHEKINWLENNSDFSKSEIINTIIEDAIDPIIEAHKTS